MTHSIVFAQQADPTAGTRINSFDSTENKLQDILPACLIQKILLQLNDAEFSAMGLCSKKWSQLCSSSLILRAQHCLKQMLADCCLQAQEGALAGREERDRFLKTFHRHWEALCKDEGALSFLQKDLQLSSFEMDSEGMVHRALSELSKQAHLKLNLNNPNNLEEYKKLQELLYLLLEALDLLYSQRNYEGKLGIKELPKSFFMALRQQSQEVLTDFLQKLIADPLINFSVMELHKIQNDIHLLQKSGLWKEMQCSFKKVYEADLIRCEQEKRRQINQRKQNFLNNYNVQAGCDIKFDEICLAAEVLFRINFFSECFSYFNVLKFMKESVEELCEWLKKFILPAEEDGTVLLDRANIAYTQFFIFVQQELEFPLSHMS